MHTYSTSQQRRFTFFYLIGIISLLASGCKSSTQPGQGGYGPPPPPELPVFSVQSMIATTYQEFTSSLEGTKDIEIRPQVDGYLDKIYVDEGALVKKGQTLFHIDSRSYNEQLNTAKAGLATAKANLANAQINVTKLTPLVQNNVISDVQLKTAQAAYDAAAANVEQAQAMVHAAEINLGYTTVRAPVDGYIGRIPMKTGSESGLPVRCSAIAAPSGAISSEPMLTNGDRKRR